MSNATATVTQQPSRKGGCLCGGIQFELRGAPFLRPLCHCSNCRKISGSSFQAHLFVKLAQVKIIDEQKLLRTFLDSNTKSGRTLHRQFCGNCGSSLFITAANEDTMAVTEGSVDDTTGWHPDLEFFCRDRKEWLPDISGTVRST